MRTLVEQSDVLIENFSAGVLDRWGLSYEEVASWNPRIVYVTMSGCGHEGPWSNLVTYAPTIHALCGLTYLSNPPGRGDLGPGFSLNDVAAGLSAAFAILAALDQPGPQRSRPARRHLPDGDRRLPDRSGPPRLADQRQRGPTDRQPGPLRADRAERLLPHRGRPVAGRVVPRRPRLAGVRRRDRGAGRSRAGRTGGPPGAYRRRGRHRRRLGRVGHRERPARRSSSRRGSRRAGSKTPAT